jgi:glutamate dehydrogenase
VPEEPPGAAWEERVLALVAGRGGPAPEDAAAWVARLPAGYRERTTPEDAATDLREVPTLGGRQGGAPHFGVRPDPEARSGMFRLRRLATAPAELTSLLPLLESFGLAVVEAVPAQLEPAAGIPQAHLDDFGLRRTAAPTSAGEASPGRLTDDAAQRLVAALDAIVAGQAEVDSLNRLVLVAGFTWRQVGLLRGYRRYHCVVSCAPDNPALDDPLVAYPAVASALLRYVEARFNPDGDGPDGPAAKAARAGAVDALDMVEQFHDDQLLRAFLALIDATLRTNWFSGDYRPLVLKFDSGRIPGMPPPRPKMETFVHSREVEGIHLRAGSIARGGVRWSTRADDYRLEVLDLAVAQVKKNAIIVPTGAKGGFIWRRGSPTPDQVRDAYATFVGGLLDVTDNVVDNEVVSPVVRADGDDPYLVVAADRGTAAFSDLANRLSRERGFWLDDAFASGGSTGYDHKAMGITARGVWRAVIRHFRQLGIDVSREPFRVCGVGDMSGDVFGNGMLQSQQIRLVAAFDHRHLFVDPDPDAARSFAERRRLYQLPRSSWADYDRTVLSPGGGVWSRDLARIDLPAPAAAALGIEPGEITPPDMITAILSAPVDLLFFGGIGTFVKAPGEADADVGDHADDSVRVTADQVRARVIAEGGNLAVTQRGRIRYSRRGGHINTDFIDNAGGVACSDREVNLKILLGLAMGRGRLDRAARDQLLADVTEEVADAVLREVDHSVSALAYAVPGSAADLPAYDALMVGLERRGLLDRRVEALPSDDELATRQDAGAGLIRPELAVLLAYAKLDLVGSILASALPDSPAVAGAVAGYFPPTVRDRFGDVIPDHRLYRELGATGLAGELVDQMGITWAHETAEEFGDDLARVASCWWAACEVLGACEDWAALENAAALLPAETEAIIQGMLAAAVATLARTYLKAPAEEPAARIATDRPVAQEMRRLMAAGPAADGLAAGLAADELAGDTAAVVTRSETTARLARVGVVAAVHRRVGRPVEVAAAAVATVDEAVSVGELSIRLQQVETPGRWGRWQQRALLDDLDALRGRIASQALLDDPSGDGAEAVSGWARRQQVALDRFRGAVSQLPEAGPDALALAALAVRALAATLEPGR